MKETAELLHISGSGLFFWKGGPRYGGQDLGYSPGGAQDRFSFRTGNILLDREENEPSLEMIVPPRAIRFRDECCFVLTGGAIEAFLDNVPVEHGCVRRAPAGGELRFGKRRYGFRTYLAVNPVSSITADPARLDGLKRGPFSDVTRWPDEAGEIRVLPGPEVDFLENPMQFFRLSWLILPEVSDMGIRLRASAEGSASASAAAAGDGLALTQRKQLISAPVSDGTVQITPAGPIVLLRERQTTGGYPRAFVVINADVDLLAQYAPGRRVRFRPVTLDLALRIAALQEEDLGRLREKLHRSCTEWCGT